MGEQIGERLVFSAKERAILEAACAIAEQARARPLLEDVDTLMAEIEHGCRDLTEDPAGFRLA